MKKVVELNSYDMNDDFMDEIIYLYKNGDIDRAKKIIYIYGIEIPKFKDFSDTIEWLESKSIENILIEKLGLYNYPYRLKYKLLKNKHLQNGKWDDIIRYEVEYIETY